MHMIEGRLLAKEPVNGGHKVTLSHDFLGSGLFTEIVIEVPHAAAQVPVFGGITASTLEVEDSFVANRGMKARAIIDDAGQVVKFRARLNSGFENLMEDAQLERFTPLQRSWYLARQAVTLYLKSLVRDNLVADAPSSHLPDVFERTTWEVCKPTPSPQLHPVLTSKNSQQDSIPTKVFEYRI